MHRFYMAPADWKADALTLAGPEAHHCRNVLRMQRGAKLVVFDGCGQEVTAEIAALDAGTVQLRPLHRTQTTPLRCHITLGQAIPKGKNMELIVQKAVEIGAAQIAPILSDRTVVQLGTEEAAAKQAKWQSVAIEAAKQCGQNWLPQVHAPRSMAEFFRVGGDFDLRLIGSLQSDAQHLKRLLAAFEEEHVRRPERVLIMIGPEGDFTPAEMAQARSQGCLPITLGPIILRVETAAIYCLSVLSYELL